MARFGGNEFTGFSIPLIFNGRYFIMEPANPPEITVVIEKEGEPVFEILKNNPVNNPQTDTSKTSAGIVTVSEKKTGNFLYKIRPGSTTSVAFGKINGGELEAKITDRNIQIGGMTVENNQFIGNMVGVVVEKDGSVGIGASIPPNILNWFTE